MRFAAAPKLLICLDFDGCVAELVADAMDAKPVETNAAAIQRLAELDGVDLAYVSGRPLQALRELAAPPAGTLLVGSHGAEKHLAGHTTGRDHADLQLDAAQQAARTDLLEVLDNLAAQHQGAWVEHKPAGGAIHVRHIDDDVQHDQVDQRVAQIVEERQRVAAALADAGWQIPQAEGNFVWLPLGEDAVNFAQAAGVQALAVRAFAGEGVRVTIGEPQANDRFIELCRTYSSGH